MKHIDKIKEKVHKLLNQAADQKGTLEGETYYQKAFELMAEYGFNERDLGSNDAGDDVTYREMEFSGAYTDMQSSLLLSLATALHCTGFYHRVYKSTKVSSATIFGLKRHLDRVEFLYTLLNPAMLSAARRVSAEAGDCVTTVVKRRSFMEGFAHQVAVRLSDAEHEVAGSSEEYVLALISDAEKADKAKQTFLDSNGLFLNGFRSQRTFDDVSYFQGVKAGNTSDLGHNRINGIRALPF